MIMDVIRVGDCICCPFTVKLYKHLFQDQIIDYKEIHCEVHHNKFALVSKVSKVSDSLTKASADRQFFTQPMQTGSVLNPNHQSEQNHFCVSRPPKFAMVVKMMRMPYLLPPQKCGSGKLTVQSGDVVQLNICR